MDVLPVAQQAPVAQPDRLQQAQQIIEANKQLGIGSKPVPPTAPVVPPTVADLDASFKAAQAAPVAPPEPIATPITAAPIDAPAPMPTAGPNSPVTSIVNDTVKEMIQETPVQPVAETAPKAAPQASPQPVAPPQELLTGTGKPAFAGTGPEAKISKRTGKPQFKTEYASLADVPKGYAVVPNAQYVDVLRGIGQPEFTKAFTG
jgi:hypothetical protein